MKRKIAYLLIAMLLTTGAVGCAQNTSGTTTSTAASTEAASDADSDADANAPGNGQGMTPPGQTQQTSISDYANGSSDRSYTVEDQFTDRDREAGYDEQEAISIELNSTSASCSDSSVTMDGSTVTITQEETYLLSGTLSDGQIIVDGEDSSKVQLVLDGVDITSASSAPIYVKQADKVFITLAADSDNTLTAAGEFVAIDDNNIDAAIFSKDDLTLNGTGALTISSPYGHGIVSKDDLVITGGTYTIDAAEHGLSGKDSIRILDGDITITAGEDGIHAKNKDDTTLGYVYIAGGSITIASGDDGIHAEADCVMENCTINITESHEGIEGQVLLFRSGTYSVVSSDDGLNAASPTDTSSDDPMAVSSDCCIRIEGGDLVINAEGDGIDSNDNLLISGGSTIVYGPTSGADGALDYSGSAAITGGTVIALGNSGMAQNFGSESTQGSILSTFSSNLNVGDTISIADADDNILLTCTAEKVCNSVIFSSPDLTLDSTYTVTFGDQSTKVTLSDSLISGGGNEFGGGFGGGPGQGGQMRPGGQDGNAPDGNALDGNAPDGNGPQAGDGETPPELPDGETPDDPGNGGAPGQNGQGAPNGGNGGQQMTPPEQGETNGSTT